MGNYDQFYYETIKFKCGEEPKYYVSLSTAVQYWVEGD